MARTLERLRTQYAAKPGDMQKGPRQGPPGRGMTGKPKNAGQTIKRLMGYVGKYWYRLVLVLLCMLITTVTSLCGGYLMAPIIDRLTLAVKPDAVITMSPFEQIADNVLNGITSGEAVQNWINSGTIGAVSAYVAVALIVLGIIYLVGIVTTYLQARLMMSVSLSVIENLRNDLFEKMQTLPVRYYDGHPTGELMSRDFRSDLAGGHLRVHGHHQLDPDADHGGFHPAVPLRRHGNREEEREVLRRTAGGPGGGERLH